MGVPSADVMSAAGASAVQQAVATVVTGISKPNSLCLVLPCIGNTNSKCIKVLLARDGLLVCVLTMF